MIGEISIGGVYVPALLLWGALALALTGLLIQLLQRIGFYNWIGSRPLADISIVVLLLAAFVFLARGPT